MQPEPGRGIKLAEGVPLRVPPRGSALSSKMSLAAALARRWHTRLGASAAGRPQPRRGFVDVAWIAVKAGDGGSGAATFARGKNKRVGPPDGGDGGAGGTAYLVCDANLHDLALGRKHFRAQSGTFGKRKKLQGRNGDGVCAAAAAAAAGAAAPAAAAWLYAAQ